MTAPAAPAVGVAVGGLPPLPAAVIGAVVPACGLVAGLPLVVGPRPAIAVVVAGGFAPPAPLAAVVPPVGVAVVAAGVMPADVSGLLEQAPAASRTTYASGLR